MIIGHDERGFIVIVAPEDEQLIVVMGCTCIDFGYARGTSCLFDGLSVVSPTCRAPAVSHWDHLAGSPVTPTLGAPLYNSTISEGGSQIRQFLSLLPSVTIA